MERGGIVYLIVGLLLIRNHEQFICVSSQALVAVDCGAFVRGPGDAFVSFNSGASTGNGGRSDNGDRSAHAVVTLCLTIRHYVFLAGLGRFSDCLLCPVGCDTDFGNHDASQISMHINTFGVVDRQLGLSGQSLCRNVATPPRVAHKFIFVFGHNEFHHGIRFVSLWGRTRLREYQLLHFRGL